MLYNNKINTDKASPAVLPASKNTQTLKWKITGMDCASCAKKVQKKVESLPHILEAKVIFSTEKLIVTTNNSGIAPEIEDAVSELGYSLTSENASGGHHHHDEISHSALTIPILVAVIILVSFITHFVNATYAEYGFILATLIGLAPILKKSWQAIKAKSPFAIETLMSISAIGALFIGATEEASMVLLLFMIGELLESFAAGRARQGVKSLMALMPEESVIIRNGNRETVSSHALQPDDIIEVTAGGRLPADAQLLSDIAFIDESALTGESMPIEHQSGDLLSAGSLVVDNTIELKVVSEPGKNAVDRILHLIENAEEKKAPIERFIDKFSRYYTPIILVVALLVLLVPTLIWGQDWSTWIYRSLTLLLIGCPCALVISTPAAITAAMANASRHGGLVKGGAALESLGKISTIAFDKTGTLTRGMPVVTDILPEEACNELIYYAASIELGSHHPLAKAILQKAEQLNVHINDAKQRKALPGMGIEGILDHDTITLIAPSKLASPLSDEWQQKIAILENDGKTVVIILKNQAPCGLIALLDELRPEAPDVLAKLSALGMQTVMLTGDNQRTAKKIANSLNIDVFAQLLPTDKVEHIKQLNRQSPTAMVGDGINDAPAMKTATIGIAMGSGTDVALETADAALSTNTLVPLPHLISLARATRKNIRQNITLAIGLKGIFLVTSILGITGLWIAVLADSGATAIITANALRLLRHKQ